MPTQLLSVVVIPSNKASSKSDCSNPLSCNFSHLRLSAWEKKLRVSLYVTILPIKTKMNKQDWLRTCMYSSHHSSLAAIVLSHIHLNPVSFSLNLLQIFQSTGSANHFLIASYYTLSYFFFLEVCIQVVPPSCWTMSRVYYLITSLSNITQGKAYDTPYF